MKLGDMASLQDGAWGKTQAGANPGTVVFFPGCWIELLLLCTRRCKRALETFSQQWKTGMCMLSSTSAWEDMSCMTKLKVVAGSVTKQSRDKACHLLPFPLAFTPSTNPHVSLV